MFLAISLLGGGLGLALLACWMEAMILNHMWLITPFILFLAWMVVVIWIAHTISVA